MRYGTRSWGKLSQNLIFAANYFYCYYFSIFNHVFWVIFTSPTLCLPNLQQTRRIHCLRRVSKWYIFLGDRQIGRRRVGEGAIQNFWDMITHNCCILPSLSEHYSAQKGHLAHYFNTSHNVTTLNLVTRCIKSKTWNYQF